MVGWPAGWIIKAYVLKHLALFKVHHTRMLKQISKINLLKALIHFRSRLSSETKKDISKQMTEPVSSHGTSMHRLNSLRNLLIWLVSCVDRQEAVLLKTCAQTCSELGTWLQYAVIVKT